MVIFPLGPYGHAHEHNKHSLKLADGGTRQPLGRLPPNQVHWKHADGPRMQAIGFWMLMHTIFYSQCVGPSCDLPFV